MNAWFWVWALSVVAIQFLTLWRGRKVTGLLNKKIEAQQAVIRRQAEVITALRAFIADAVTGKRDSDKVLDEEFIEG